MGRIADRYTIPGEKYEARFALLKYVAGMNTALIAATLVGAERGLSLTGREALTHTASESLKWGVIFTVLTVGVCLLALALNYHLRYYTGKHVARHEEYVSSLPPGLWRLAVGSWVRFERLRSDCEVVLLIVLVGTWWVFPCLAVLQFARAFGEILP